MKAKHIIGIDPDVDKSGVAYLEVQTRRLEVTNLTFPQLLEYLQAERRKTVLTGERLTVIVEAGWKVAKSNFHTQQGRRAERVAKNVGSNHEVGRKIVEMCNHYKIEVIEQYPLRKCWKGKDRKITHEEIAAITGIQGRTNQETRDAALLAWNYAELPMRI